MSQKEINMEEYVDHRRWLLNNGLVTDDIKNQLFFCGSIVHKEVQAVELDIDADRKIVKYTIYVNPDLLKKIAKYHVLSKSDSLWGLWRFRQLLKKEGSLDFQEVLGKFVKDFCGPQWSSTVNTVDFNSYVDGFSGEDGEPNKSSQLPNK